MIPKIQAMIDRRAPPALITVFSFVNPIQLVMIEPKLKIHAIIIKIKVIFPDS